MARDNPVIYVKVFSYFKFQKCIYFDVYAFKKLIYTFNETLSQFQMNFTWSHSLRTTVLSCKNYNITMYNISNT